MLAVEKLWRQLDSERWNGRKNSERKKLITSCKEHDWKFFLFYFEHDLMNRQPNRPVKCANWSVSTNDNSWILLQKQETEIKSQWFGWTIVLSSLREHLAGLVFIDLRAIMAGLTSDEWTEITVFSGRGVEDWLSRGNSKSIRLGVTSYLQGFPTHQWQIPFPHLNAKWRWSRKEFPRWLT